MRSGSYLGLNSDAQNIAAAWQSLPAWGESRGFPVSLEAGRMHFHGAADLSAELVCGEALAFCDQLAQQGTWDLLVAHAFLDLFDLPSALPRFLRPLKPGGLCYFTINFDGDTILEPAADPFFDELVIQLYHRSMDERLTAGKRSGDSRAGRHLFNLLRDNRVQILGAGASDWVVFPGPAGYPADEAYFLHHIVHFFESSLSQHPHLDGERFSAWLAARHAQVDQRQLVYVAHQIDFLGMKLPA